LIFREVEDRDLIGKARRGDVDAYNGLVSRWEKRVYTYLVRAVGDREDALDLAQETFLKAYRGLARLESVERFPQWLFRIAHNESISMHRRNRMQFDYDSDPEAAAPAAGRRVLGAGSELKLAVEQALDRLTPEQREAVVLKVYQGFKFDEIAAIVGCPASTVKSRVYSGMEALKGMLGPTPVGATQDAATV
jgi:RNA polymerase sigma-70 factor (ECF subfamily)